MTEHIESVDCWCEPGVIVVDEESRVIVHHPWQWSQFTAFRKDGRPLCPRCGEDELWTPWTPPADAETTLDDYVCNRLRCLACGWSSS